MGRQNIILRGEGLGTRATTTRRIETTGGLIDSVLFYGKITTGYLQQPGKYPTTTGPQKRSYRSTVLYWMTPGPYRYR